MLRKDDTIIINNQLWPGTKESLLKLLVHATTNPIYPDGIQHGAKPGSPVLENQDQVQT